MLLEISLKCLPSGTYQDKTFIILLEMYYMAASKLLPIGSSC